jgi:hypothetical protein
MHLKFVSSSYIYFSYSRMQLIQIQIQIPPEPLAAHKAEIMSLQQKQLIQLFLSL